MAPKGTLARMAALAAAASLAAGALSGALAPARAEDRAPGATLAPHPAAPATAERPAPGPTVTLAEARRMAADAYRSGYGDASAAAAHQARAPFQGFGSLDYGTQGAQIVADILRHRPPSLFTTFCVTADMPATDRDGRPAGTRKERVCG